MSGDTSDAQLTAFLSSRDPEQVRLDLISHMSPDEVRMLARWRA